MTTLWTSKGFSLRTGLTISVMLLLALAITAVSSVNASDTRTYEVTVVNLTDGQWFTPPVIVTHRSNYRLFQYNKEASFEIKEIAENGNLAPMLEMLENESRVVDFEVAVAGDPPPLAPQNIISAEIEADSSSDRLSLVSMLICTNDGITGRNQLRLPRRVGNTVTYAMPAWDAGTEINTEDFADIVPPCPALTGVETDVEGTGASNPALAENGVIKGHPGITGVAGLDPEIHGWVGGTGIVVITRTN